MRPPICAICSEFALRKDKKSGLITFVLSEEDKKFNERFKKPGFIGHPMGKEWFCGNHYESAKKLKHLTLSEAIAKLKKRTFKVALIHFQIGFRGGLETSIRNYLKYFVEKKADITLYYAKMDAKMIIPKGVKLVKIDVDKIPKPIRIHYFNRRLKKVLNPDDFDFSLSMGRTSSQYYTIAANTHYGHLKSLNRKIKSPLDVMTINLDNQANAISKKIFSCSQMVKDEIIHYHNEKPDKIDVLYPPMDLSLFNQNENKEELRKRFKLADSKKYFLFVSTSHKRKGLPLLQKIFSKLDKEKYCLLVAGTSFESKVSNIISLGFITDIHLYFRAVDFLIHPAKYEPFGYIVPESLACGTPVIISKHTGAKEILTTEDYGKVVKDYNVESWVNDITEMAEKSYNIPKEISEINELSIEQHMNKMSTLSKIDF